MSEIFTLEQAREKIAEAFFKDWEKDTPPYSHEWSDMEEILVDLGKIDLLILLYKEAIELYCPEEEKPKYNVFVPHEPDEEPDHEFPLFIWFAKEGNCAMRLQASEGNEGYYWRDGGAWGVNVKSIPNQLTGGYQYVSDKNAAPKSIASKECFPCTKEEWFNDNGEWAPDLDRQPDTEETELPF
jgi:hypothetical protein